MSANDAIERLYRLKDAAVYLNLSHEHVRKLCREGKLPCRNVRGKYLMSAGDIATVNKGN